MIKFFQSSSLIKIKQNKAKLFEFQNSNFTTRKTSQNVKSRRFSTVTKRSLNRRRQVYHRYSCQDRRPSLSQLELSRHGPRAWFDDQKAYRRGPKFLGQSCLTNSVELEHSQTISCLIKWHHRRSASQSLKFPQEHFTIPPGSVWGQT